MRNPAGHTPLHLAAARFERTKDVRRLLRGRAERAAEPTWHRRCAVRIHPGTIGPSWRRVQALLADETLPGEALVEALREALDVRNDDGPEHDDATSLRDVLAALAHARGPINRHHPYGGDPGLGTVLVAERGLHRSDTIPRLTPTTEADDLSHRADRAVTLEAHSADVANHAGRYVHILDLPPGVQADVVLAAWFHDAGKADPRFQRVLGAGAVAQPLAKSPAPWSRTAAREAGLPSGWRHEALSVRMARTHPRFAEAQDPALVLWLIGTHHGLGRPFFGFTDRTEPAPEACLGIDTWQLAGDGPGPDSTRFDFDGLDWPALYDELKARYGIWGLAHLKAIMRLADHRASEAPGA